MKKIIFNIALLLGIAVASISCEDDMDYGQFARDNRPEIPVTYQGATTYGHSPFYTVSASSTEQISITVQIPQTSGRTIREITRVVGGSTAINAATVTSGATAANTIASGIQGSGTTATFTTSLPELRAKFTAAALQNVLNGVTTGSATYTEFAFMFLLTLDDNQTIVPVQLRLRITPES